MNYSEIVEDFEKSAIRHREAVLNSDVKGAVESTDQMKSSFQHIHRTPECHDPFLNLLSHPNAAVRLMASAFGLNLDEESCVRELQELERGDELSFEAGQCLQRWKEGHWTLDKLDSVSPSSGGVHPPLDSKTDALLFGESIGNEVPWGKVSEFDTVDMRVGCVNIHFANIIGVNEGFIEFCPNSDPPSKEELLAWVWVIRPELQEEVLRQLGDHDFAMGIRGLV